MGVIPSSRSVWPRWSVTTAPGGRWTSRPGTRGVVMTTSPSAGDGNRTVFAVSRAVSQIVYSSAVVVSGASVTPTSKTP